MKVAFSYFLLKVPAIFTEGSKLNNNEQRPLIPLTSIIFPLGGMRGAPFFRDHTRVLQVFQF